MIVQLICIVFKDDILKNDANEGMYKVIGKEKFINVHFTIFVTTE